MNYELINSREDAVQIKAWIRGVGIEDQAKQQLRNVSKLPIVGPWIAAMPDVHWGLGATIGSVIPTKKAIIPAAVGVDIGCGMTAVRTTLTAGRLPDNLRAIRDEIEKAVPHGRTDNGGRNDRGAWHDIPMESVRDWKTHLEEGYKKIVGKHPKIKAANNANHLGTLGTGNHFLEVCLDEQDSVWVMLHSGSRGIGNKIGTYFIELAKKDMEKHIRNLPDKDLAYFEKGAEHFDDYVFAVEWAQNFARLNRKRMMDQALAALLKAPGVPEFQTLEKAVSCHHNYVTREVHFGEELFITRKGAIRAGIDDLGIIPGSMGAKSFIVRGKGNPESFESASHGAGRSMSRNEAKKKISLEQHAKDTSHVECRKDKDVLDETPRAYKDIEKVMQAQSDLVEIVHTLHQIVCVKG
ncbi:MAG: RtcB family protein [Planctomycetes bacterium]|nr:RtcB family protein [Planctomycetota bacterium]